MDERFDVVVVGGGLAGLSAATYAARGGARTLLLERAAEMGGRGATQEKGGFFHNLGPHAVYANGAGKAIYDELGIEVRGGSPGTAGYAIVRGKRFAIPAGARSLLTTRAFGLRAKRELGRILFSLRTLDTAPVQSVTVDEWLAENLSQPAARDVLRTYFRVSSYSNAPAIQSAGAALDQFALGAAGVIYADGGWRVLVDALRGAASGAGATIESQARVEAVRRAGSGWTVTTAPGRRVTARAVVLTGDPQECALLLDNPQRETVEGWTRAAIPVRAACLDLALERLPNSRGRVAFGFDQPYYLSVHSAVAKLAPEGKALVSLAKYLPPDEKPDGPAIERDLEAMMDLVQPGWRTLEIHRRFLPSLVVTHAQATAKAGGLAGRPGPAVPGADGLFVAGDWIGPVGMLSDASLASGKLAAEMAAVVRDEGRLLAATA